MSDAKEKENPPENMADIIPEAVPAAPKKKNGLFIAGILLGFILTTALGGLAGYYAGLQARQEAEANNRALAAAEQFLLGVEDFNRGNYSFAKQRFEYVIQLNPSYPGVLEKMAEIAIIENATATPSPAPELTAEPTIDTSGVEGMLAQAKQFLAGQNWDKTMETLDMMRKENPGYKTLEVDGLYYLALRNRGLQQIQQFGKLEMGIFDITRMAKIGPIDKDARDAIEWAAYYIFGAAYYGVDWSKVVKDLKQVVDTYPYLMDQNQTTAVERYRKALVGMGDALLEKDPCKAIDYYSWAQSLTANDKVGESLAKANRKCEELTPNSPPVFTGSNLPDGTAGAAYMGSISASDMDGEIVTFTDDGILSTYGLSMDANGNINGVPASAGQILFNVTITDTEGGSATQAFTININ